MRAYREQLVARTGLTCRFPLWGIPTSTLARQIIDDGIVAHLVCVDTTQLDGAFAGARYDDDLLARLPDTVDPCGEGGEFHTFVSAHPAYLAPIAISLGDTVLRDGRFMYCDVLAAMPAHAEH